MRRQKFGSAKIALVAIIDEEFNAICKIGGFGTRCQSRNRSYSVQVLTPGNLYDVVVCRSDGWGNLASGEAVTDVIEDFRPHFIILCGIAGGIVRSNDRDPIKVGDVLVADYLHYSELKKLSNTATSFRYQAHDHPSLLLRITYAEGLRRINETQRWLNRLEARPPDACTPVVRVGNLVTGETLFGGPANPYQRVALENYYTALGVDMESMGVAREMFHQRRDPYYNPQFLVVRGISDLVRVMPEEPLWKKLAKGFVHTGSDRENQATRDAWRVYAAEAAAAFALTVTDDVIRDF
jgi:nucleoside phosphorylase